MDFSILIAVLGVLVAALAEARTIWRDKQKDQIRSIGLSLLQLLNALDGIIETGEKIITILAETPVEQELNRTSILPRKDEIIPLIEKQSENFQILTEVFESRLSAIDVKSPKLGDAIEFMIADQVTHVPARKAGTYLKILTWKLLEGEYPFSRLSIAAHSALKIFSDSTEINHKIGYLSTRFPTKIRVYDTYAQNEKKVGEVDNKDFIEYDLTKLSDLRRLLEKGKNQLQQIRELREQIAQFITRNVSITDLV